MDAVDEEGAPRGEAENEARAEAGKGEDEAFPEGAAGAMSARRKPSERRVAMVAAALAQEG